MKIKGIIAGAAAGFVNGLLGSGGGMIIVPSLAHSGIDRRRAHCTSLAVMLPVSAVSAGIYLYQGSASIGDVLPYIPGGVIGAVIGGMIMKRLSPKLLRRAFGAFALWAGIRLLMR